MAMDHYDVGKMRSTVSDIRSEITAYKNAKEALDTTVTGMQNYWQDENNQKYVAKYNKDLKPTAEGVQKLMETYATFLEDAANAVEKAMNTGNAAIN